MDLSCESNACLCLLACPSACPVFARCLPISELLYLCSCEPNDVGFEHRKQQLQAKNNRPYWCMAWHVFHCILCIHPFNRQAYDKSSHSKEGERGGKNAAQLHKRWFVFWLLFQKAQMYDKYIKYTHSHKRTHVQNPRERVRQGNWWKVHNIEISRKRNIIFRNIFFSRKQKTMSYRVEKRGKRCVSVLCWYTS